MTQEEGDRLLREAEEAYAKRRPAAPVSGAGSSNGDAPAARSSAPRSEVTRAESARGGAVPKRAAKRSDVAAATKQSAAKKPKKK